MRWITRILITLTVLLLIAAAGIQAVLWSDWPRREVIARLQQETGLVIEAGSMRTGWFGRTSLKEVSARLPLADQPFAQMPELRIEHTALLPMILRRHVDIESIHTDGAQIHLVEDAAGRWNVQQVSELIAARRATKTQDGATTPLPLISIRNAQVSISNNDGKSISLPSAQFTGKPTGLLEWTCEADALPLIKARGRLAIGEGTPHELQLQIAEAQHLLSVIARQQITESINADAAWSGTVQDGSWQGRAQLRAASMGEHALAGTGTVSFEGGVAIAQPHLTFTSATMIDSPVTLSGGMIAWRNGALQLQQSQLHAFGAVASVHGRFDTATRAGRAETHWSGRRDDIQLDHRGAVIAEVNWPEIGTKRIDLTVETAGSLPDAQWASTMQASAAGDSWREMTGRIAWPKLTGRVGTRQADLSGLSAKVNVAWPALRIDELALPNAAASGVAAFDAESRQWSADLAVKKWTLPITGDVMELEPLDVKIQAKGSPQRIDVAALDLRSGPFELNASGTYAPNDQPPLFAQALMKTTVATPDPPATGELFPATVPGAAPATTAPPAGGLEAHVQLRGSPQPLAIDFIGHVNARNLPIGDGRLDQSQLPISGSITSAHIEFHAADAALFDGVVDVHGTYRVDREWLEMHITARDASIEKLAQIAGAPATLQGRASGAARVALNPSSPQNLTIQDGQWTASNVHTPAGPVAHASGTLRAANGMYEFTNTSLVSDAAANDAGTIDGGATFNASNQTLTIDARIADWPWIPPGVSAAMRLSGPAQFQINLAGGHVAGTADVQSTFALGGEPIGELRAHITAHQRTLHISELHANLWNGTVNGGGAIALDHIAQSRGELQWRDVDLSTLAALFPQQDLLNGRISGSATIQPAPDPRALGPLQFAINLQSHDVHSRSVGIGDITITGFAGPHLLIADDARINFAGGEVRAWGRISQHGNDPFAHLTASFDRLDLNQLVHWVDPEEDAVPGRLSGIASAGGYLRPVGGSHRLFGQSDLTLIESDLVNITLFTLIHDALSLSIGDVQPHGQGTAGIRLEGNALELSRLEYYNRGTDVVASVRIEDIRLREKSPISGVAVGAMRPLKKIDLPLFKDFDRALKALQTGAASVRMSGTLETPEQKLVPFAEIAGAFERILTGSSN